METSSQAEALGRGMRAHADQQEVTFMLGTYFESVHD